MALNLTSAINLSKPLLVNKITIVGYCVNTAIGILDVTYQNWYDDGIDPSIPVGERYNLHIEGEAFNSFVAANSSIYSATKEALYTALQTSLGTTGTVI